jgi:hypothetical protein
LNQDKRHLLIVLISILVGIFVARIPPGQGKGTALLTLEPQTLFLKPGEQGQISVWVREVADLYGAEIKIRYDPSVLEVVDSDPNRDGVQVTLSEVFRDGFVAVNQVDNQNGLITVAATRLNPAPPFQGEGELIEITINAKAIGASDLVFDQAILANRNGMPIEFEAQKASFTVNEKLPESASISQQSENDQIREEEERRVEEEKVQLILLLAAIGGILLLIASSILVIRASRRRHA